MKPLREYVADLTSYVNVSRILRIGRRATSKAQEESRRLGIPNVYSINGHLHYELPNGELTTQDPLSGNSDREEAGSDETKHDGEVTGADAPVPASSRKLEPRDAETRDPKTRDTEARDASVDRKVS